MASWELGSFDDTAMPAKVADHANGTQRGRLWLYIGDVSRVGYCVHATQVLDDARSAGLLAHGEGD